MSFVELLIPFLVVLLTFLYFRSSRNKSNIPGPWTIPILGNLHLLGEKPHLTFTALREKYGDIYSFKLGSYPAVVLNGSKVIREALAESSFSGRHLETVALQREGGIVLNESKTWAEQRRFFLTRIS